MTNQEFNHANIAKVLASGMHNATSFEFLCEIAAYNCCDFGDTIECVECFENSLEAILSN
ncbi:hypothetical protein [Pseudomonas sp.]|uniref:hypothetical protein n=1 Tax=Pseudomonas sp. TaxID=306 RepID=UPI003FD8385A